MVSLKKLAVTAVKIVDSYIVAGIGGDIAVFDWYQSVQLRQLNVLDNRTIHAIVENKELTLLCILGGKHLAILQIDTTHPDLGLRVLRRWQALDWILCGRWLSDTQQLVLLSAHNVVSLWDHGTGTLLSQVACTEKCILYSGILLGNSMEELVVIGGTVFTQVIVWTAVGPTAPSAADNKPVVHKLHGHKGVIFSVRYDSRARLITSTSDDRTVRMWSVSPADGHSRLDTAAEWSAATISLSYTIFGHSARVWQSHVLANREVLSVGEDSQLCLWRDGGTAVYKRPTHQNAGVWCMAVDEARGVVVTGGGDGGISVWPLWPPVTTPRPLAPPSNTPRRVTLLSSAQVLVTTEGGHLLSHERGSWSVVFSDERFSSYCLLEQSPSRQYVALASINGHIIILTVSDFTTVVDMWTDEGRIFALHWLDEQTLLSCHKEGQLYVWRLSANALERVGSGYLPVSKERWTTAAVMVGDTVVYGDRAGNIHSSSFCEGSAGVHTVAKAHNRLGVCSLTVYDSHIWSTGRDRTVSRYSVCQHTHCLRLVSSSRLPFEWLASLVTSSPFGLAILCFHETRLVLWSVRERKELLSVECGGGHRSWSCLSEGDHFYFTYLKDKTAHLLECPLLEISRPAVMDGFHAKEINSMAWISGSWAVSGGEDGSVRVSNHKKMSWRTPLVEQSHLSSVRSVHVEHIDDKILVFSAGGRAEMLVWQITLEPQVSMMKLTSAMLREERTGRHWLSAEPHSEPETRFMDVHALPLSRSVTGVIVACSDAYLRLFHFDNQTNSLSLWDVKWWCDSCVLRVTSCVVSARDVTVCVTSGTDGQVRFWAVGEPDGLTSAGAHRLHQSGVNALSVSCEGRHVLVATGGDDNAVSVCCFDARRNGDGELQVRAGAAWRSSDLHSSVVTGARIVGDRVLFCGGDQRVTLVSWSINTNSDTLTVQVLTQCCCSVPDIKGLSVLQPDQEGMVVCLYGVGLEILKLEMTNDETSTIHKKVVNKTYSK